MLIRGVASFSQSFSPRSLTSTRFSPFLTILCKQIILKFLENLLKSCLHGSGSSSILFFPIITPGWIRKFPRNFLMYPLFNWIWRICEPPILIWSSQGWLHQKIPWEFSDASQKQIQTFVNHFSDGSIKIRWIYWRSDGSTKELMHLLKIWRVY